jgi:hypothetical protein
MPEENKTPVEFSDEMIRRFLLGGLSSAEQPVFEQSLFSDDDLDARVRRAELVIADDYAYDRLNQTERDLFEKKFLVSAERRRKAEVSRVLRERFATVSVTNSKAGVVEGFRAWFAVSRPAWRLAFGAVLLLILFGTALLVIKEPRLPQQIVNQLIPRRRAPRSAPREVNHPTNESPPVHQETPSPLPPHEQSSATMSVELSADTEAPIINVPRDAQGIVRFQLAVPADKRGSFRAELLTSEGQTVFTAESITANGAGAQVDFDVAAAALRPGNYQITLTRDNGGTKEAVGNYRFRLQ